MAKENLSSGKNDPKRRALSTYLKSQFAALGHNTNSFALEYGIPQRSLSAIINCESSPNVRTLEKIAEALTEATGRAVTAGMLGDVQEEGEVSAVELVKVSAADFDADALLQVYKNLPFEKQVEIGPELIRLATNALELATAKTRRKVAILIESERFKSGKGTDVFARKNGLDPDLTYSLMQQAEVAVSWSEVQKIAEKIRDEHGNYGNLVLFSRLLQDPLMPKVSTLLHSFMEENNLQTVNQLAGRLIKDSKLELDRASRQRFVAGLEKLLNSEKQLNYWDPELIDVLPAISVSLGFGNDVTQFIQVISEYED